MGKEQDILTMKEKMLENLEATTRILAQVQALGPTKDKLCIIADNMDARFDEVLEAIKEHANLPHD